MSLDFSNFINDEGNGVISVNKDRLPAEYKPHLDIIKAISSNRSVLEHNLNNFFKNINNEHGNRNKQYTIQELVSGGFFSRTATLFASTIKECEEEIKKVNVQEKQINQITPKALLSASPQARREYEVFKNNFEENLQYRTHYRTKVREVQAVAGLNTALSNICRNVAQGTMLEATEATKIADLFDGLLNRVSFTSAQRSQASDKLANTTEVNSFLLYNSYLNYHFSELAKTDSPQLTPEKCAKYNSGFILGYFISSDAMQDIQSSLKQLPALEKEFKNVERQIEVQRQQEKLLKKKQEGNLATAKDIIQQPNTPKIKEGNSGPDKITIEPEAPVVKKEQRITYEDALSAIEGLKNSYSLKEIRTPARAPNWHEFGVINMIDRTEGGHKAVGSFMGNIARIGFVQEAIKTTFSSLDKDSSWQMKLANTLLGDKNLSEIKNSLVLTIKIPELKIDKRVGWEKKLEKDGWASDFYNKYYASAKGSIGILNNNFKQRMSQITSGDDRGGKQEFELLKAINDNKDAIANAISKKNGMVDILQSSNPDLASLKKILNTNSGYKEEFKVMTFQHLKHNVDLYQGLKHNPLLVAFAFGTIETKQKISEDIVNRTASRKNISQKTLLTISEQIFNGASHVRG